VILPRKPRLELLEVFSLSQFVVRLVLILPRVSTMTLKHIIERTCGR